MWWKNSSASYKGMDVYKDSNLQEEVVWDVSCVYHRRSHFLVASVLLLWWCAVLGIRIEKDNNNFYHYVNSL